MENFRKPSASIWRGSQNDLREVRHPRSQTITSFPFGKPTPNDPTKHMTDITSAWDGLRERSSVDCRFHDLRHTVATNYAEAGVPESTMLALYGPHVQGDARTGTAILEWQRWEAVEALTLGTSQQVGKSLKSGKSPTIFHTIRGN